MAWIETGDLTLASVGGSRQTRLFNAIREKIVQGLWHKNGKLPSTRKLAEELSLSRNTVIAAYEQLVAEGYLYSRSGSGFYVALELPEDYLTLPTRQPVTYKKAGANGSNPAFATGIPDLAAFPYAQWQRLLQRQGARRSLLGNSDVQGNADLRAALADYLASSRSVACHPDRILITAGAQQALAIAVMAVLTQGETILMEQPGYARMGQVIRLQQLQVQSVAVHARRGLDIDAVLTSNAQALYITPSNQYPMGTTITTDDRVRLIHWATQGKRWIIEDDYDSEFQFAHRPYTSLQGLAGQLGLDNQILYVGSLSKVMFNGLRLGYLVVPDSLVKTCVAIKDALSGALPTHTQAALAEFIQQGDLTRHIRKMRRLYKAKYQCMCQCIHAYFGDDVEIISQAAGLHLTLRWQRGPDEELWAQRARQAGIVLRPLSDYEQTTAPARTWHGAVLGFGNVAPDSIDSSLRQLAALFYA